jgi:methylenetetrahydrofolate reductase (NADPH)
MNRSTFSFEMFPPKMGDGIPALMEAVHDLAKLKPAFMTMTFGAGGSGRKTTAELVVRVQKETGIPTASHLTFVNLTRSELRDFTNEIWNNGIRKLVALRGDFPPGWQAPDYSAGLHYRYTDEFVADLRAHYDFEISVAAYPEKHPDAPDLASDIEALKKKCAAGATRAITQFFFENDAYYRFLDLAAKAGIQTPIVPGILPIGNFQRMVGFAKKCGTAVPAWLHERFEGLSEADTTKLALELLEKQITELKARGASHFHFYTLNKSGLCALACRSTGLVVQG